MTRERRNAPQAQRGPRHRGGDAAAVTPGERVRLRLREQPELELSDEELRALADEGIDPEDVRRAARDGPEQDEASDHDRDTARDQVEGLVLEQGDDY